MSQLPVVKEHSLPQSEPTVEWTHTVDRQEQMYMIGFALWLIPTIVFHIMLFLLKTPWLLLQRGRNSLD